jgi:hypothetical protein
MHPFALAVEDNAVAKIAAAMRIRFTVVISWLQEQFPTALQVPHAGSVLIQFRCLRHSVLLVFEAPFQHSIAGMEMSGRTIPLTELPSWPNIRLVTHRYFECCDYPMLEHVVLEPFCTEPV